MMVMKASSLGKRLKQNMEGSDKYHEHFVPVPDILSDLLIFVHFEAVYFFLFISLVQWR